MTSRAKCVLHLERVLLKSPGFRYASHGRRGEQGSSFMPALLSSTADTQMAPCRLADHQSTAIPTPLRAIRRLNLHPGGSVDQVTGKPPPQKHDSTVQAACLPPDSRPGEDRSRMQRRGDGKEMRARSRHIERVFDQLKRRMS